MPGPKPKPDELKLLEGVQNVHPNRINNNRPKPKATIPTCPPHLTKMAKAEWKRICPELESLGLLTKLDRAALAAYCQAYGRWAQAEKKLIDLGNMAPDKMAYLYKTTNGNLIINPLLSVANKAMEQMHKFLTEFGMTPSSRTRISVNPKDEPDEFEKMMQDIESDMKGRTDVKH